MKTLELMQMENLHGGISSDCAGFATAVFATGVIIGAATGGIGLAIGGLVGGWLGAGSYGACLFEVV